MQGVLKVYPFKFKIAAIYCIFIYHVFFADPPFLEANQIQWKHVLKAERGMHLLWPLIFT